MRILLADDHALFRAGMASLLRASGIEVAGEVANGFEALEAARRLRPDLIMMDIAMPDCNGLEATRLIKAEWPQARIVIVTASDADAHVFEAIKSGAEGYLLKDASREELDRTLEAVAAGRPALSPGLAGKILDEFLRLGREGAQAGHEDLTPREREVLQLVAGGSTNREIGAALTVSVHTVDFHMRNILRKLHLKNRAQAVAYAVRTGLVSPGET